MTSLRRSTRARVASTAALRISPSATFDDEMDVSETLVESPAEDEVSQKKKDTAKKRKRKNKDDDDDDFVAKKDQVSGEDEEAEPKKDKRRGARKPKEPIVYDIPDVEHRMTTFKGRLGYACLNTILRDLKPAYNSVFCSRTCRIDTMKKKGMRFVKELGKQNLRDMLTVIKWNEEHNIRFMRLSSNMFPFASHGQYGYSLFADESKDDELFPPQEELNDDDAAAQPPPKGKGKGKGKAAATKAKPKRAKGKSAKAKAVVDDDADAEAEGDKPVDAPAKPSEPPKPTETIPELLAQVGALARQYGHRLTSHPGQFVQLGSPSEKVRASSIRELVYHAEMMEGMGLDQDSVMIVHGGGTYGNKAETLERIKRTIRDELPANVRARLVLENDEICYAAEDLLPLCEEMDVPLVFDYHHHNLNPSSKGPVIQDEADCAEVSHALDDTDAGAIGDPEDVGETSQGVDGVSQEGAQSQAAQTGADWKPEKQFSEACGSRSRSTRVKTQTQSQSIDTDEHTEAEHTDPGSDYAPDTAHTLSTSPPPGPESNSNLSQREPGTPPPTIPQILARTNAIFARRGIRPKQHLSEPRKGAVTLMERRAHADRCQRMPEVFDQEYEKEEGEVDVDVDVDLMIEAKDKEQAVFHLYRIYNIAPVKHESLRPAREETKETRGRKSNKRAKAKKEAEAAEAEAAAQAEEDDADADGAGDAKAEDSAEPLEQDEEETKPKANAGRKRKAQAPAPAQVQGGADTEVSKPKPKKRRRTTKVNAEDEDELHAESLSETPALDVNPAQGDGVKTKGTKPSPSRSRKKKAHEDVVLPMDDGQDPAAPQDTEALEAKTSKPSKSRKKPTATNPPPPHIAEEPLEDTAPTHASDDPNPRKYKSKSRTKRKAAEMIDAEEAPAILVHTQVELPNGEEKRVKRRRKTVA